MHRRTFLKTAAALSCTGFARAADAEIEIAPDSPGPLISPHLYGHFIEHLGGVIYDGIWVGRNSRIPNVDGIRGSFAEDMKYLGAPNLRWPGGCFADGYHWRDGIGPVNRRPRSYNFWQRRMPASLQTTPQAVESNQVGIHEFVRLCRLTGAEPYVAANVGSGTPREFHEWLLYCNAPAGTISLADERAANGDREPFQIRYWGVGNESWGCGGTMRPGEYAAQYRQFVTQIPEYTPLFLVATGPRGHSADMDMDWTTGFFEAMKGYPPPGGFSVHFYTDLRPTRVRAAEFNSAEWYEVLLRGIRMNQVIEAHWAEMAKFDPAHRCKLVVDEWGVWYPPGEEIAPAYTLSQPITLRDAVHTALTFDIFNRHAGKLAMANVAQTVNCIHSLFLAREDRFCRTPVFHVFDMYRPHKGARSLAVQADFPVLKVPALAGSASLPAFSASASVREKRIVVTVTNPSVDSAANIRIRLSGGARPAEARGTVLTHGDMRAANTFDRPNEVRPAALAVKTVSGAVEFALPKHSIAAVEIAAI